MAISLLWPEAGAGFCIRSDLMGDLQFVLSPGDKAPSRANPAPASARYRAFEDETGG